jgi:CheY-like chemotaxis protein
MMGNGYSVLCVDDEPAVLMTQAEVLRHGGFTVYTATSLTEARAVLSEKAVDGVVLDASVCNTAQLCMYDALREIQPKLTVVLHTGNPEVLHQNCVQDKPTIAKPVPPNELVVRLKQILESRR